MVRTPFIGALALSLASLAIVPIGKLRAQAPGAAGHDHLTEVACVDVPPGEKRPEFGCFNIGTATGLHFDQASVYWHLRAFPNRKAAEAAKSATGIVVEEDGRGWLSEFGPRNAAPRGGEAIAVVGPLQLPAAKSYSAVLSYAVMRPGDSSRVHTHPGPEGWYVIAGEQCLETPAGADRARAGGTMTVRPDIPMELNVTGATLRRAFALVIHDSTKDRGIPSDWKPSGACGGQAQPPPSRSLPADVGSGRVAWFDITTTDLKKSTEFYSKLFDWTFTPLAATDQAVEIVSRGTAIGTIRRTDGQISTFDGVVYIQVDDLPASCKKAKELGGTIPPGFPFDLPDARGAIALVVDPAGHPVGMYSRKALPSAKSPDK